jgi:hypothetical protein
LVGRGGFAPLLREQLGDQLVRIVAVTAYADESARVRSRKARFDAQIAAPAFLAARN